MPEMSVRIVVAQTSQLLILFSGELKQIGDYNGYVWLRAAVLDPDYEPRRGHEVPYGTVAHPGAVRATSSYDAMSFTFYMPNVTAGAHKVILQWTTATDDPFSVPPPAGGLIGRVDKRTLTVIALPEA
jgi:hypothetical protein